METRELDPLFDPSSLAIVGASPDSWYSSRITEHLTDYGYDGEHYLVNPNRERAWDRRCYDAIADLPEVVDLAVVVVPREHVVDVVREAGEVGVPAALVITTGFSEADEQGAELEAELEATAANYDISVAGPNCIGLANAQAGTVLTGLCSREPEPGQIGLASQSGALSFATFFENAADEDTHFSHIVSTGNEVDQSLVDYVEYMAADPDVEVICTYIEGVTEPRRFIEVARETVATGTPVLAVKVGSSDVAQAAAESHTGSLTGNDAVWDAAFGQAGIERLPDVPDLTSRAQAHAAFDPPDSNRVCVASTSGGLATLLADLAEDRGLDLPQLADGTEKTLLEMEDLLTFGELHNPVDIRAQGAEVLPDVAETLFADDAFDAYVFGIGLSAVDSDADLIADHLLTVAEMTDDPVIFLWTGRREPAELDDPQPYERVRAEYPLFYEPSKAIDALASLVRFDEARDRLVGRPPFELDGRSPSDLPNDATLTWSRATSLLDDYGIDLPATRSASSSEEAARYASRIGTPVVMKVDSPDIAHRNEVGAVRVGVESSAEAQRAYEDIVANVFEHDDEATIEGVLVQEMIEGGVEALVGASQDPNLGPVVTLGSGGTQVEALQDTTHLVAPFGKGDAYGALKRTDLPARFEHEFGPDASLDSLANLITKVGNLVAKRREVAELDLNPVLVRPERSVCVDAFVKTD
ncbi:acetate--CoA ligase family protein [Haloplanus rubicundus]|uniref:acetate--CoA ligase (ADP-forming) n=1 Tax=Haloplanus rubicundus TaxID=1547898 RepID=A0A345EH97_9EURY|nr:acetate--CoA ligase family protein [Haloplanus rubicundus]AXG11569.1 CoA-binding protein [Haloplanus rubicundus]